VRGILGRASFQLSLVSNVIISFTPKLSTNDLLLIHTAAFDESFKENDGVSGGNLPTNLGIERIRTGCA
jgi:hypothetical protein